MMSHRGSNSSRCPCPKTLLAAQWLAYLVAVVLLVVTNTARFERLADLGAGAIGLTDAFDAELLLDCFLLALFPVCWFVRGRRSRTGAACEESKRDPDVASTESPNAAVRQTAGARDWLMAVVVGGCSLAVSAWISARPIGEPEAITFGSLPPAYHDEFSYLFQAKTFLAGRLSFPSHETMPELFDQMHVLNEGRFASRYFPGTGAWMAPFLAVEHPYWGHWLAGALSAMLIFWAGRELGGSGVGAIAGMLMAVSPGIGIFGNLLLAHHPTLLGLSLFTFCFLRLLRTRWWCDALLAGAGLAFAMLCRPMTAAGFGAPFGLVFFVWLCRHNVSNGPPFRRYALLAAMVLPLALGGGVMLATNHAITGAAFTTPYQVYTDTYTPRHVYGFNNRERGEQRLGPRVIENYDRWAENLTPALAVENIKRRFTASLQWTLGLVPLAMGAVVFLVVVPRQDRRWWLIPAAIVSLHAVHVPYWFVGIMEWHYVFETAPLWILMFAGATGALLTSWRTTRQVLMRHWWYALVATSLFTAYVGFEPFWTHGRAIDEIHEIAFSRTRYQLLRSLVERDVHERPAILLIEHDPADRSIDFVVNTPDLKADVLYGRMRSGETQLSQVQRAFPDRTCYVFRPSFQVQNWTLERVEGSSR